MSQSPKPRRWGLWATFGLSLGVLALFFLSQTLVVVVVLAFSMLQQPGTDVFALAEEAAQSGFVLALATVVSAPLCLALITFFIRLKKQTTPKQYLELHVSSWKQLALWSGITVVFIFAIDALKSLIDRPVAPTFTSDIYNTAYFLPLLYVAIVIAAPVFEEVFFRGFLFQGILYSPLKAAGAVVITSLLWAIIHAQYDRYDMAGIFLFGVLLGVAQLKTRSLYVPITMHALNNLLALIQVAVTQ